MRALRASVLQIGMHHGLGGIPPLCGGPRGCSWTAGGRGPRWPGSVLGCRAALDCVPSWVPGQLSTSCPAGPSQMVPYRLVLQSAFLSVAPQLAPPHRGKHRPPPARSQVSLIADAPHLFKSTGIWASERLGDRTMPPEVMGTLDTGCTKNSTPRKKIFALRDCVQVPCYVDRPPRTQRHEVGSD